MTEVEKIEYAKFFIDKLANGINPIDDSEISESELINNVRISRCFFYVSDILRQVIENGGITHPRAQTIKKAKFFLNDHQRTLLVPDGVSLTVSKIAAKINTIIDTDNTEKISNRDISKWLEVSGFLESVNRWDGKKKRIPTAQGKELGIITENRSGEYGSYTLVLFPPTVQQFIFDNIDAIINLKYETSNPLI